MLPTDHTQKDTLDFHLVYRVLQQTRPLLRRVRRRQGGVRPEVQALPLRHLQNEEANQITRELQKICYRKRFPAAFNAEERKTHLSN